MHSFASTAKILIATDIFADAEMLKRILKDEFEHIYTSMNPDSAVADFISHQPDVLVLAFNELEKSERYYLDLFRHCPEVHQCAHRTLILCNKDEVTRASELCMKDIFDDYVLFWPMTYDAPRLNMSVHNALRELAALKAVGHRVAELAVHSRPLAKMEQMLDQQSVATEVDHNDTASIVEQGGLTRPNILVVDDDDFQHKLIGKLLEKENYHLMFASNGREALNMIHKAQPDIVLMDIMMPDMDGLETMRNLKAEPKFAKIPVIMITGKSEGRVVIDSLKAGAANFVVKPFDQATLIAKIDHALGMTKQPYPVK